MTTTRDAASAGGPTGQGLEPGDTDTDTAPAAEPAGAAGTAGPAEARDGTGRQASVAVTVLLFVAVWVVIFVALAFCQLVLNRYFGVDFAFGSLPGIWDFVIALALFMLTWRLVVRRRHPRKD